jgi:hypothetical protein
MSGTGIYLIRGENDLVEMTSRPFENEDLFQKLLAQYPRILGGDQFDREAPRKWLLITREAPIPDQEEGADRWSVDHLFVDEDAVPTFVEVKRSSDTRIRREVVGQMLDYVSHASATWREGRLRAFFEAQCADGESNEVFQAVMGPERDIEQFWQAVNTNLHAGKVRLVFVADLIPSELRRIIEFLNRQMNPAEVLGIEIHQYIGGGLKTLVPRVIGQTAETQATKGGERGPQWDPIRFFKVISSNVGGRELEVARRLLDFAEEVTGRPAEWGTGNVEGSFTAALRLASHRVSLFSVWSTGAFAINLPWNSAPAARQLLDKYNEKAEKLLGQQDKLHLSMLVPDSAESFMQLMRELAADLRAIEATPPEES